MKLKKSVKRGIIVISIYIVTLTCVLMATDRIERLDQTGDFRNKNESVAIKLNK